LGKDRPSGPRPTVSCCTGKKWLSLGAPGAIGPGGELVKHFSVGASACGWATLLRMSVVLVHYTSFLAFGMDGGRERRSGGFD